MLPRVVKMICVTVGRNTLLSEHTAWHWIIWPAHTTEYIIKEWLCKITTQTKQWNEPPFVALTSSTLPPALLLKYTLLYDNRQQIDSNFLRLVLMTAVNICTVINICTKAPYMYTASSFLIDITLLIMTLFNRIIH